MGAVTREQVSKTMQLTLDDRKEIIRELFMVLGIKGREPMAIERGSIEGELRRRGYAVKLFDLAFACVIGEMKGKQ